MILFLKDENLVVSKKRLILVELNEFNEELLQKASNDLNLRNIRKFLHMQKSETISLDKNEHFGLDPWVQWVSIHTGCPHEIHKIDHLADVKNLKYPQIWEILGEKGFSSGIWGAMNSSKNNAKGCCFFLPDPWTYYENASPDKINDFLALPRYFSKNYLSLSIFKVIQKFFKMLKFLTFEINLLYLYKEISYSFICLLRVGLNDNLLFSLFDLISAKVFVKYKRKFDPNLSIIFFNCLAHAQHKEWSRNRISGDMKITIKTVDRILGIILDELEEKDSLVVLNGLGQKNVDGANYFIYRQNNPKVFLKNLEINFVHLEQCMTNESHVTFASNSDLQNAITLLKKASINEEKLFVVERDKENAKKIFFQLNYYKSLDKDAKFFIDKREYKFFKYFSLLARRTGAHTPYGAAFSKNFELKSSLYNHEISESILNYFS